MPEAEIKKEEEVVEEEPKGAEDLKEEKPKDAADEDGKPGDDKDTPADEDEPGEEKGGDDEPGDDFSAELIDQAASHGYDEAAAKAFGTADNLQKACAGLDSKLAEIGRKAIKAGGEEQEPRPAPKPRSVPRRAKKQDEDEPAEELKAELGDDVDPEIAKVIKGLVGQVNASNKTVAALQGKLADTEQFVLDRDAQAFRARVDGLFAGLDDEWEDTFGKELSEDLPLDSPKLKNRLKVLGTCEALERGLEDTDTKVPSAKTLLKRAVRADFGEQQKAMTRKALGKAAKKRSAQISSRPTSRRGKTSGRDAAFAVSEQWDKDHPDG